MIKGITDFPEDLELSHKMITDLYKKVASFEDKISESNKEEKRLSQENKLLRERVNLLMHKLFGKSSEKHSSDSSEPEMRSLFSIEDELSETEQNTEEEVVVKGYTKKKSSRKPLPDFLSRKDVIHDISESEKQCGCGSKLSKIGEDVFEKLEIIPAVFWVSRHIRLKYACKNCEGTETNGKTVKIAEPVPQIIPKSYASSSLLANLLVNKYCDSLPLYRQEQIYSRAGIDLGRGNMSRWVLQVADKLKPMIEIMEDSIKASPLINLDETRVQVLKEPEKSPTNLSYMWVGRGINKGSPVILFRYSPNRNTQTAKDFIGDYQGCIQTDGYSAYSYLDNKKGIVHAGCWAHVRRKFKEVTNAVSANKKEKKKKKMLADIALNYIGKLYEIEQEAKENRLSGNDLLNERKEKSLPILEKFKEWLLEHQLKVSKELLLGKAIGYTLNQWDRLIKYVDNSVIGLDNNMAENAIRPFVVGRKNWLFSDSVSGVNASAVLYSIIETAKANDLNSFWYLYYIFEKLPLIKSDSEYDKLMPNYIDKKIIEEFQKTINEKYKLIMN